MYISDEVVYNIILACSKMLGQWKWAVKSPMQHDVCLEVETVIAQQEEYTE